MDAQNRAGYPSVQSYDSQIDEECEISADNRQGRFPIRILIAALGVSVCLVMSSTKYNLPVAMVDMVHDTCTPNTSICRDDSITFESLFEGQQSLPSPHNKTKPTKGPKLSSSSSSFWLSAFEYQAPKKKVHECNAEITTKQHLLRWGEVSQGIALGVYYYGFTCTSIFGGRFAEKYKAFGSRYVVSLGLIGSAIFNALLPVLAKWSFGAFIVVRILTGACHGVILPALFFLFQNWFPKREHTLALSFLLIGTALGLIINVPIIQVIKNVEMLDGWPMLFYGGSLLHVILLVFWWFFVTDEPEGHNLVQKKELSYIRQNSRQILEEKLDTAPWREIIKSKTLYASIMAKFCWSFNHAIIIDNGPSYLNRVAGSDWSDASIYIALVYTLTSLVYLITSPVFNYILIKSSMNKTRLRKLFQTFVFLGASITMFILPNVGCNERAIVALIATNMAFQGFIAGGEFPMLIDYSGNYAGTVFGIASIADSVARFLAPFIRGELIKNENTLYNWNILFTVSAILNVSGLIVFRICADANLQPWAVKKEFTRQLSDDGHVTDVKLSKTTKRNVLHEVNSNPYFRAPLNTNNKEWKDFKVFTIVQ